MFYFLSTHPWLLALPFHIYRRALLACLVFFLLSTHLVTRLTSPHTQTSLFGSSSVLFAFHTPCSSPFLSTHPDEPYRLVWCSFCFPLSQHGLSGVVDARLFLPHTQMMSLFDSSGVLFTFHTALALSSLALHLHTALSSSSPAFPLRTPRRAGRLLFATQFAQIGLVTEGLRLKICVSINFLYSE